MRAKNICPWCGREGDPIEIIMNKPTRWTCECGHGWDINDDFICAICGNEVTGGIFCCSSECNAEARRQGII